MSTVCRVRDLGHVIDGRVRKSWPFARPAGVHKTKGLRNPGLLCYRNAVLQCLLHTPEFYRYLCRPVGRRDRCATPGDNCVYCALRGLAMEYWSNGADESQQSAGDVDQQMQRRFAALNNLNTAMNNHPEPYPFLQPPWGGANNMNMSGQQDAHEYLLGLINMLKYENGKPHPIRNPELRHRFNLRTKAMNRLFHLRTKTTWTCEDCNTVHVTRSKEVGLNLSMPENPAAHTLEYYLDSHFEGDTAQDLECDSTACNNRRRDRERSTKIVGGPEILIIQLARMRMIKGKNGMRMVKVTDHVEYSDRLDLSDYSDGCLKYQLNGIVAHNGNTLTEGHYVAMVRSQGGNGFVICNDRKIDDSKTKEQVLSRAEGTAFQSYLLVYQKTGGRMANCV